MGATQVTTCQVCARPIRAAAGLIAHHGYQRPYRHSGWQTSSCPGARYVPWEEGHDGLDAWVDRLEEMLTNAREGLRTWLEDPPAAMVWMRPRPGYRVSEPVDVPKPEGWVFEGKVSYPHRGYAHLYSVGINEREAMIERLEADLRFCRERRETWLPPADSFTLDSLPRPRG